MYDLEREAKKGRKERKREDRGEKKAGRRSPGNGCREQRTKDAGTGRVGTRTLEKAQPPQLARNKHMSVSTLVLGNPQPRTRDPYDLLGSGQRVRSAGQEPRGWKLE